MSGYWLTPAPPWKEGTMMTSSPLLLTLRPRVSALLQEASIRIPFQPRSRFRFSSKTVEWDHSTWADRCPSWSWTCNVQAQARYRVAQRQWGCPPEWNSPPRWTEVEEGGSEGPKITPEPLSCTRRTTPMVLFIWGRPTPWWHRGSTTLGPVIPIKASNSLQGSKTNFRYNICRHNNIARIFFSSHSISRLHLVNKLCPFCRLVYGLVLMGGAIYSIGFYGSILHKSTSVEKTQWI